MLTQQQRNHRRKRATPKQLAFLREKFLEDPKPDQATREAISRIIDMTPRSVQIWFQNNRAKTKLQEQRLSSLYPTICSEIGRNRSRIYFDTNSLTPQNCFYECDKYAMSMPLLSGNSSLDKNIKHKQQLRSEFSDVNIDHLDEFDLSKYSSPGWKDSGFFLRDNYSLDKIHPSTDNLFETPVDVSLGAEDEFFDDIEEVVDFDIVDECADQEFINYDSLPHNKSNIFHERRFNSQCDDVFQKEPLAMGFHSTDNLTTKNITNKLMMHDSNINRVNRLRSNSDFNITTDTFKDRRDLGSNIVKNEVLQDNAYSVFSLDIVNEDDSSDVEITEKTSVIKLEEPDILGDISSSFYQDEDSEIKKDTFIVIPCNRIETFENVEIFSETVKDCIEIEYSPVFEKIRIYIDPSCFPDDEKIIRVVEANVKEVLDYSNFHLHIRTDGLANFYTVDNTTGDLVFLKPALSKSEFLLSTEYSIYGTLDELTEDEMFKCTSKISVPSKVSATNRFSYDLKKILDPDQRLLV